MRTNPRSVKESYVFSRAYRKGKSVCTDHVALYLLPRRRGSGFSLGITVSKKLGGAVRRNRVKRLVREGVRRLSPEADGALIVVARARAFSPRVKLCDVETDLARGMRELGLL